MLLLLNERRMERYVNSMPRKRVSGREVNSQGRWYDKNPVLFGTAIKMPSNLRRIAVERNEPESSARHA